jgi:nucleotide-binding universal stress UspA family protein
MNAHGWMRVAVWFDARAHLSEVPYMNTPIIAGIDFSASSPFVLRHAVHVAALKGVPVVAAHVLDAGRMAQLAGDGADNSRVDMIFRKAKEKLETLVETHAPGAEVIVETRIGKAADVLQNLVAEHSAALLVIAANDLTKKRLGTVASRCVRNADCDVLVLRDWQEGAFKQIGVCTDFSATATKALERGIELAKVNGASLEIVHVIYPPKLDPWGESMVHPMDAQTPYADECHTYAQRRMESFLAPHAEALASLRHEELVLESQATAIALTSHFRAVGTDLVVLGTHRLSRMAGFFLGTNAENLLHEATVSVLAVRD